MRIVVTGGSGFIGRALMGELHRAGHEAVAADVRTADSLAGLSRCVDVLDVEQLKMAFSGADIVCHLAGPVLDTARSDPFWSSRMQLFGTLKVAAEQLVLGYARKFGLKYVILRFGSAFGWGEGSNLVQAFL